MNKKKIIFESTDASHEALILKLRQIKVSQKSFFNFFMKSFLGEEEYLTAFTSELISQCSPIGKKSSLLLQKSKELGEQKLDSLNLSKEEREEIFDILELENFE